MEVTCCCDGECLVSRISLLETLCGFQEHPGVLRAVRKVQRVWRRCQGRRSTMRLRQATVRFKAGVRARRARRRVDACARLQAWARGAAVRDLPVGRALRRVWEERAHAEQLEIALLRRW